MKKCEGFTLIELLIIVAVLAVLSSILIPEYLTSLQKAKQKETMEDLRNVVMGLESYLVDQNRLPLSITALSPFYVKNLKTTDAWGHPFVYATSGTHYSIGSPGKDGIIDLSCTTLYLPPTTMAGFNQDIIFSDGKLVCGPKVSK